MRYDKTIKKKGICVKPKTEKEWPPKLHLCPLWKKNNILLIPCIYFMYLNYTCKGGTKLYNGNGKNYLKTYKSTL